MKRKIKIILSLLLLFGSLGLTAQSNNPTIMQKLINKTLVLSWDNENDNYAYKQQYTSTQITKSVITNFGTTSVVADFYLSNQIETTFSYSKIGNATDGKYIISFIPEMDGESIFNVDEIIEITDTYLETKSLKSGSTFKFNIQ
ncbi:MAG: hypothetical protein LBJ63_04335 [Prevotellaceae bacterium]|jgi:hypothetical protein|nr:hypothetical protein [Prevotellaceae bacterium]